MAPHAASHGTVNLDDDAAQELVVALVFPDDPMSEMGAYYFALYDAVGGVRQLVNTTRGGLRSVPPTDERTKERLFDRISLSDRGLRVDAFIASQMDESPGYELVVPRADSPTARERCSIS
ncbi:MAG: hypothetical protein MI724_05365 [Spirochaetales bacterium]|nr:hypothetical protein [Spirochaetales bacterium]